MTQKLVKTIISDVASSYQVNLVIEVPNITENEIKFARFHLSTLGIFNAHLNIRRVVGKFF